MQRPEYFVLRIYRLEVGAFARVEGIAECVASGEQFRFADAQELWAILEKALGEIGHPASSS